MLSRSGPLGESTEEDKQLCAQPDSGSQVLFDWLIFMERQWTWTWTWSKVGYCS